MNREDFLKLLEVAPNTVNQKEMTDIIKESYLPVSEKLKEDGVMNLVIVMEEFAEIIQEVSKYIRGKGDRLHLLEELADSYLSIKYIQEVCGISDDELIKAINVKLQRQKERNEGANNE